MKSLRVALLFGGVSGEHDVSCLSASSILMHLDPQRYEILLIGIAKDGRWYRQPSPSVPLKVKIDPTHEVFVRPARGLFVADEDLGIDVVFPINHGIQGEDGKLQGLLECAGLAYCGGGVLASALGMDKVMTKLLWERKGLPVVPWLSYKRHELTNDSDRKACFQKAGETLGSPLFLKPSNSGSSVGVAKVLTWDEFEAAIRLALSIDETLLIEKAVDAREIEVAVMGCEHPTAYGPGEVAPTHEFYDYEAKYLDPDGAQFSIPAQLPPEVSSRILSLAIEAYQALGLRGFARVDFFVSKVDSQLWINEINTLPGFTTISMFPRMVIANGHTYAQVLDAIIDQALRR